VAWWKVGLGFLAVALAVVGVQGLVAAGGLDLTSAHLERSLGAKLQKEGPPATREGRGQDVACEKEDLRGESWTCVVDQEIAILPDAHAVFGVSVAEDLCWRARLRDDGPDFDGDELLGRRHRDCVRN
jgi:hypothetical protein